jgi:hypothetical protein
MTASRCPTVLRYSRDRTLEPAVLTDCRRDAAERAVDARLATEAPGGPPAGGLRKPTESAGWRIAAAVVSGDAAESR